MAENNGREIVNIDQSKVFQRIEENGNITEGYTSNFGTLTHTLRPGLDRAGGPSNLRFFQFLHNNYTDWQGNPCIFDTTLNIEQPKDAQDGVTEATEDKPSIDQSNEEGFPAEERCVSPSMNRADNLENFDIRQPMEYDHDDDDDGENQVPANI